MNYEDVGKTGHKRLMRIADAHLLNNPEDPVQHGAPAASLGQSFESLPKEPPTQIKEGEEDGRIGKEKKMRVEW